MSLKKIAFVSLKLLIYENSSLFMKLPAYAKFILSLKCPVYWKSNLWISFSMKRPIDEISCLCPFYEMSYLWFCYLYPKQMFQITIFFKSTSFKVIMSKIRLLKKKNCSTKIQAFELKSFSKYKNKQTNKNNLFIKKT